MEYFFNTQDIPKNSTACIFSLSFASAANGGQGACPGAQSGFVAGNNFLAGPVPAGGGTVTGLEVLSSVTAAGAGTLTFNVIDNTAGVTKLSCTIDSGSPSSCSNSGSASVAAGDYLVVQVVVSNDASVDKSHNRVSFRY